MRPLLFRSSFETESDIYIQEKEPNHNNARMKDDCKIIEGGFPTKKQAKNFYFCLSCFA